MIRFATIGVATLAALAGLVLLFVIGDPPLTYALSRIATCAAVAAVAYRAPRLALALGLVAAVVFWVLAVITGLGHGFPLGGSAAEREAGNWSARHDPFDMTVVLPAVAYLILGIATLVRGKKQAVASAALD
jgi:cbb3-type cytochrome oxidase subunit 1